MKKKLPTILGLMSILFWSTSIAFTRSVSEKTGTLNTAFFNMLWSGLFLVLVQLVLYRQEWLRKIKAVPITYYFKTGSFMLIYGLLYYIAVGEASTRESVLVVGIINYLWPGLAFLFAVPILGAEARRGMLTVGVVIALIGTAAALLQGRQVEIGQLAGAFKGNLLPYLLMAVGAVSWALYSNLTRKHKEVSGTAAVPYIFLAEAVIILIIQIFRGEVPQLELSGIQYVEFAYLVVFPTAFAYLFWDKAMKEGNKDLIISVSYFIPLASTAVSGLYLGVPLGIGFLTAAILVMVGAFLCRKAMKE